jgi:hypothetical protein
VATFGSAFTMPQVNLLVNRWKNRIVLFDPDAINQAKKLANLLSGFPGKTVLANLETYKDPGELSVENAREIMKKLKGE